MSRGEPDSVPTTIKKEQYQFTFAAHPEEIKVAVVFTCWRCGGAAHYFIPFKTGFVSVELHHLAATGFKYSSGRTICNDCSDALIRERQ